MTDPVPSKDQLATVITNILGERCPTYHADCMTCRAWQMFDALCGVASCGTCEACRGAATRALGGEPAADVLSQIDDLLQTMIVSAEVFTDTDGTVTGYKIKTGALHKIVGLRTHLFFPQNMKEAERPAQPPGDGQ